MSDDDRMIYDTPEYRAELNEAIGLDHSCSDSCSCDIAMALSQGFVYSAAWLLTGATETPYVDQVIAKHGGSLPNDGITYHLPVDFDGWSEWYKAHTWNCEECNGYTTNDVTMCGNCLAERI